MGAFGDCGGSRGDFGFCNVSTLDTSAFVGVVLNGTAVGRSGDATVVGWDDRRSAADSLERLGLVR